MTFMRKLPSYFLLLIIGIISAQQVDWVTGIKNKPTYDSREYNFNYRYTKPLIIGGNTITINPMIKGLNSFSVGMNHQIFIHGTGTDEVVTLTAWTSTSISFTCQSAHTGNTFLSSSTLGLQEIVTTIAGTSSKAGSVLLLSGLNPIYGKLTINGDLGVSIRGQGKGNTYIQMSSSTLGSPGLTGTWFHYLTGTGAVAANIDFGSMSINDVTGVDHTAGHVLLLENRIKGSISGLEMLNAFIGIRCTNCNTHVDLQTNTIAAKQYAVLFDGIQTNASLTSNRLSGGVAALAVLSTTVTGWYASNNLYDNTATGGTSASTGVVFTEVINVPTNELILSNSDFESVGACIIVNGNGVTYINNSIHIVTSRWNCGTYGFFASGKVDGPHLIANFITLSSASAVAGIYGSDVHNLTAGLNKFNTQGTTQYCFQGAGTTNYSWNIYNNMCGKAGTTIPTNAVALPNGMDDVRIEGNDFSSIVTPINNFTGTNIIINLSGIYPFANLFACTSGLEASEASVSDSNTNTWGAIVANGGANRIKARCNGTNWTVVAK